MVEASTEREREREREREKKHEEDVKCTIVADYFQAIVTIRYDSFSKHPPKFFFFSFLSAFSPIYLSV